MDHFLLKVTCQTCKLHELCLPDGLNGDDLKRLDEIIERPRPLRRGEILYRDGNAFQAIYAVRAGAVKVHSGSDGGDEQVLGFYLPGEMLGMDGIATDVHQCTAIALETSSVCALPFNGLNMLCEHVPGLQRRLLRLVARELTVEHELLLMIGQKSAEERLAIFLVTFAARFKRLGYSAAEFRLPMSRHDLANYLGLTPETVSRLFGRFRDNRVIETDRSLVRILDMPHLLKMCSGPDEVARVAAIVN